MDTATLVTGFLALFSYTISSMVSFSQNDALIAGNLQARGQFPVSLVG